MSVRHHGNQVGGRGRLQMDATRDQVLSVPEDPSNHSVRAARGPFHHAAMDFKKDAAQGGRAAASGIPLALMWTATLGCHSGRPTTISPNPTGASVPDRHVPAASTCLSLAPPWRATAG